MNSKELLAAQELHDLMVIAHDLYKNKKANQVAKTVNSTKKSKYKADEIGLCLFVAELSYVYSCRDILEKALESLYGDTYDPFSNFKLGSYWKKTLCYKTRSREALNIAKWIAKEYNL